jgi:glycine/D-amino acid oxidase-like deaminating enzyme
MLDVRGVTAALWCPTDGYLQPNSLTTAYAQLARSQGATIATDTRVVDILVRDRAVVGLATTAGTIRTEMVVNAAGPWAWQLAQLVGLDLPIVPVRHEYFISEPVEGWHADLPALRLPDSRLYVRSLSPARFLDGGWTWEDARRRAQRHYEDYYVVSPPVTVSPVDQQEPT